jgi:hypothetical protein
MTLGVDSAFIPEMRRPLNNFRARLSLHMPNRSVASRRLYPTLELF